MRTLNNLSLKTEYLEMLLREVHHHVPAHQNNLGRQWKRLNHYNFLERQCFDCLQPQARDEIRSESARLLRESAIGENFGLFAKLF